MGYFVEANLPPLCGKSGIVALDGLREYRGATCESGLRAMGSEHKQAGKESHNRGNEC